ncbi:MAG: DUF1003 domain-containing protein [Nanoarchaeota archaeon]|nr:DUF1003 domain-containing protein [Nanoarchaeota archaeon]
MVKEEEVKRNLNILKLGTETTKKGLDLNYYGQWLLKKELTIGQKSADVLTKWAGSWIFIFLFFVFLGVWMGTNGLFILKYLQGDIVDVYPFILLNLVLSCLAAIQAPVILMSQNRSAERDRIHSEYDYSVNRKAEREIREIRKDTESILRHLKLKTKKSKNSFSEKKSRK